MKKKILSLLMITATLVSLMTITFADFTYNDALNFFFDDCNATWARTYVATYTEDDYSDLDVDEQEKLGRELSNELGDTCSCGKMHFLRSGVTEAIFTKKAQQQYNNGTVSNEIGNMTTDMGIKADTELGTEFLSGFVQPINVILGVIVVLITVGLAIFTAFDVCYIVFPVFRDKCEDAKMSGDPKYAKPASNGGTKLRFVSDEAQFVVENCSVNQGKSPLTAYLGKRIWVYIAVSVILFILLTGNINVFTNIALKIVSYIIEVLGTLG